MEQNNAIHTELRTLGSGLAGVEPVVPYRVPGGYFDAFPAIMLNLCKMTSVEHPDEELALISPLLSKLPKAMPYTVPEGYFSESQPGNEADELPAVLKGLNNKNTYRVPESYFNELPGIITTRATKPEGKVVTGAFSRNIFKYAVAAVITGIALTTGYFVFEKRSDPQQLVSDTKLKEKASQASDEDIINYLRNVPLPNVTDPAITGEFEIKDDAILELLADVTDEELQQYMQVQTGSKILFN